MESAIFMLRFFGFADPPLSAFYFKRRSAMNKPVDYERVHGQCKEMVKFYVVAFLVVTGLLFFVLIARGEEVGYTNDQIANAIYKAEGGDKTSHPYGILAHYKHTSARQACINSIKSARKRFANQSKDKDFIHFLSLTYCPVGAKNDPRGLNRNWVKNVHYFLGREL
jgi:hypothetical protein